MAISLRRTVGFLMLFLLVGGFVAGILAGTLARAADAMPAAVAEGAIQAASDHAGRVVVDFGDLGSIAVSANGAVAAPVKQSSRMRITTEPGVDYPSVHLRRMTRPWDLSGFNALTMEVENLDDQPVRVLLSANNPGADGRNHCNTESVAVPSHGQATLELPFGVWHGDTNHPIDLTQIESLAVLLDRPKSAHRFIVGPIRAVQYEDALPESVTRSPFFQRLRPAFGRGVNLADALEAPREGEWGLTLEEKHFDLIHAAGFQTIRLPVRWSAHAQEKAPYRIDPAFLARVEWAVAQATRRGITIVVNMHHYDALDATPDGQRDRFVALWRQIAERFHDQPPGVAFELYNEPHDRLDAPRWNAIAAAALAEVRRSNPQRTVVVGPVDWNSIRRLPELELPEGDRNLVATFHYYEPFNFTHQGADWAGPEMDRHLGTQWTGSPLEQHLVRRDFNRAIAWAVAHERPIWLGEFGAYSKAAMDSRVRWTRFIAGEAFARKIGYAYWEFCAGFGVYDRERQAWNEGLLRALLPQEVAN